MSLLGSNDQPSKQSKRLGQKSVAEEKQQKGGGIGLRKEALYDTHI